MTEASLLSPPSLSKDQVRLRKQTLDAGMHTFNPGLGEVEVKKDQLKVILSCTLSWRASLGYIRPGLEFFLIKT